MPDKTRSPIFQTATFATDEPVLFETAIQPWNLSVDLRHARAFSCEVRLVKFDGITVYRDSYGHGMRLQGMTPPGLLTLSLPITGLTEETSFWGKTLDDLSIYSTFHREIDSITSPQHGQIIILLDAGPQGQAEFPDLLNLFDGAPLRLSLATRSREELVRFCLLLLQLAAHPGFQGNNRAIDSLRARFLETIRRALTPMEGTASLVGQREASALAAMFDVLEEQPDAARSVKDLSRLADISERTLERAVRARYDCTVQTLLRRLRLHQARRHLLTNEEQASTVTQIAFELGFFDTGRFAGEYRKYFGELPSLTLKRHLATPPAEALVDVLRRTAS